MNYFTIFAVKQSYDLDLEELHNKYLALQTLYHPDHKPQSQSLTAIDLNNGYKILKDDLLRAEYLLSLYDIDIYSSDLRNRISDLELDNIWQNLERIENMTNPELLAIEYQKQQQIKQQMIDSLTMSFKTKNLKDAIDITLKFKYLMNLMEKIKQRCK